MIQIPQSTSRVVMLKLFTTGTTTAATGKTVAITISKAGGAFGNPNAGATNATEVSNGWYKVTLDTTDTNTLGDLAVRGTAAACDDTERLFGVVKATNAGLTGVPDAVAGANTGLPIVGTQVPNATAGATGGLFIAGTNAATTVTTAFTTTFTGNLTGSIGSLATQAKADVNAECDTALVDAKASYAAAIEAAILDEGDATALLAAIAAKVEDFLINEGDSRATLAAIATAVWSASTRRLSDGTNIVLAKGTGITGFNDLSAAQVNAEVDTALTDYNGPTNAQLTTALAAADDAVLTAIQALSIPTFAQIWTGSLTESFKAAGAVGTPAQLLQEIVAHLSRSAIVTTTKTIYKADGSTPAKTYTLNAIPPTAIGETT